MRLAYAGCVGSQLLLIGIVASGIALTTLKGNVMPEHWFLWMMLMYLWWGTEKREYKGWVDWTFIVTWIVSLGYGLFKEVT
jgi:hypothetical protein